MTPPGWRGASRPCAWAAGWKKRGRHSGNETLACAFRDRGGVNFPALWTSLVAGGQPSAPKSHKDIGSGRHGKYVVISAWSADRSVGDRRIGRSRQRVGGAGQGA